MRGQPRRLGISIVAVAIGIGAVIAVAGLPGRMSALGDWGPGAALARGPAQRTALRLGLQPGPELVSVLVAQEQGWLEEAGLTLEVRALGWGEVMESLAAGGLDVGAMSPVAHVVARALGHDLRVIAAGGAETAGASTRALVVAPGAGTTSVRDLADRYVAVAGIGGPDHLVLREWLERQGIAPGTVRLVEVPAPELWRVLAEGRVAAALVAEPYLSGALAGGARRLGSPYADLPGSTPLGYFVAEAAWLRTHGDVARRFAGAVHRAHAHLESDPAVHREALARHLALEPALAARVALPALETRVSPGQVQAWTARVARGQTPPDTAPATLGTVPAEVLFDTVR